MHLGITTFDVILRTTLPALAVAILAGESGLVAAYTNLLIGYSRMSELKLSSHRLCLLQHPAHQRHPPAGFHA